jgi:uncharacterized protein YuzE
MKLRYDKKADAIYILLTDNPYAYGKDLDDERRVDYDTEGNPRGIELLCVSTGVLTDDLPDREAVEKILGARGIKVLVK